MDLPWLQAHIYDNKTTSVSVAGSFSHSLTLDFFFFYQDELMSNEELFFSLSQVLRKFPKETGKLPLYVKWLLIVCQLTVHLYNLCSDKVLCHFCFKPKKVTEEALRSTIKTRKVQMLISDIIVLKTALDALPFLSKVCMNLSW